MGGSVSLGSGAGGYKNTYATQFVLKLNAEYSHGCKKCGQFILYSMGHGCTTSFHGVTHMTALLPKNVSIIIWGYQVNDSADKMIGTNNHKEIAKLFLQQVKQICERCVVVLAYTNDYLSWPPSDKSFLALKPIIDAYLSGNQEPLVISVSLATHFTFDKYPSRRSYYGVNKKGEIDAVHIGATAHKHLASLIFNAFRKKNEFRFTHHMVQNLTKKYSGSKNSEFYNIMSRAVNAQMLMLDYPTCATNPWIYAVNYTSNTACLNAQPSTTVVVEENLKKKVRDRYDLIRNGASTDSFRADVVVWAKLPKCPMKVSVRFKRRHQTPNVVFAFGIVGAHQIQFPPQCIKSKSIIAPSYHATCGSDMSKGRGLNIWSLCELKDTNTTELEGNLCGTSQHKYSKLTSVYFFEVNTNIQNAS